MRGACIPRPVEGGLGLGVGRAHPTGRPSINILDLTRMKMEHISATAGASRRSMKWNP